MLLDLPDHDSVRLEHRLEVDRLVELVDVLVWVLDPEKYADAAVHDRYLRPLAGHAGTLLVVLNQVDRLADAADRPRAWPTCAGCWTTRGWPARQLLTVSARTGDGLPVLRDRLGQRVAARRAADRAADRRRPECRAGAGRRTAAAARPPSAGRPSPRRSPGRCPRAAGVPAVTAAVERSTVRAGTAATGWPVVRWLGRLRPDPLRRLHLGSAAPAARCPRPASVQQAGVATAVRRARDAAGEGLPLAWADDLRRTSRCTPSG